MAVAQESVARTLGVAVGVALLCSVMVSAAVLWLRPIQTAYADIERNKAIVQAAGMLVDGATSADIVSAYLSLEARVVQLATGQFISVSDAYLYDHWDQSVTVGGDLQSERSELGNAPVYLVREAGRITRLVLPVHGEGMWSTIYGYVALGSDLNTVADLVFFRHGETPGIGDRIQDPKWIANWRGKRVYGTQGTVRITVGGPQSLPDEHRVDGISGATVTGEAVGRFVSEAFGEMHYGPLLRRLRADLHASLHTGQYQDNDRLPSQQIDPS